MDTIDSSASRWFVVCTQPHREQHVETRLRAQDFRAFLPLHLKTVRHARRIQTVKAPLFPRYLFVELDLARDRWRSVNGTIGVARMIMAGEEPKPVPRGVVEQLSAKCDATGVMSVDDGLRVGHQTLLVSGPFAGRIGTLMKLAPLGRVQLLLEVMGGQVSVSANREALSPVA